jgi:hypothetical protein
MTEKRKEILIKYVDLLENIAITHNDLSKAINNLIEYTRQMLLEESEEALNE